MKIKNSTAKFAKSAMVSTAFLIPSIVVADGLLGDDSTDSITISITKEDSVRISAMEDVDFGSSASLAVDSTLPELFCVFASNGGYKITGSTGTNSTTDFEMVSGTNILNYQLALTTIGATATPMVPEVAIGGLTGNTLADDCLGIPNTTITVTVLAEDFNAAAPGAYSDTLTMFVEPE